MNCYCAQTDTAEGSGFTEQIPAAAESYGFGDDSGTDNITTTALYFDEETSGLSEETIALAKTTDWLQTRTNYEAAGWDFDTIWVLEITGTTSYWETVETQNPGLLKARRLIPFEYSTDDAYVLEFGHEFIGFLRTTQ